MKSDVCFTENWNSISKWTADKSETVSDAPGQLGAALEALGVELEWSDEWVVQSDNASKCYRTTGDSYGWQSSILWTDGGDFLTPDDDIDAWIEEVKDNPQRCLASRVWSVGDLASAGKSNGYAHA